ncbi:MAG: 5-formyltetrahydrofolate cyclo-ligase, partial [Gammaproteobacteria bacterium]
MRLRRASVSAGERRRAARRAAAALTRLRCWSHARHVARYLAYGSELPTAPLLEQAWMQHKRVYVPRL